MLWAVPIIGSTATAQVSELLQDDGDVGDPLGSYYLGRNFPVQVILGPSANGYRPESVSWTIAYTYGDCTEVTPREQLGDAPELDVLATSVGTFTVSAAISYYTIPTQPPTTPPVNTVSGSFTIAPPTGVELINYNASAVYALNQPATIQFQLQYGGVAAAGYNMECEEKISISIPANAPPPFDDG